MASALVFIAGCDESSPTDEGTATIYVVSEDGVPIQNALVLFESPVNTPNGLEVFKYTGIDGSTFVKWNYDLYIDVTVVKGSYKSCTAIHVIPGESTEKELTLLHQSHPGNGCP